MILERPAKLLFLSVIIAVFLIAPSAFAKKDEPLKLSTKLNKTQGTIGDVFELALTMNYDSKVKLVEPIKPKAEGLTIQSGKKTPPIQKGSRSVEGFWRQWCNNSQTNGSNRITAQTKETQYESKLSEPAAPACQRSNEPITSVGGQTPALLPC